MPPSFSGILGICCAATLAAVGPAGADAAEPAEKFEDTKAVLAEIYHDEVRAYSSYRLYADKAEGEGYPRIAVLFRAIAVSEMIHARNMKELLRELGEEVADEEFTIEVSGTRDNLRQGMDVELAEINDTYPAYIERLEAEGWQPAIEAVRYSWNSEKQHSDNIRRIRRFVGWFFGAVAEEIESGPEAYHVCTVCGSTVGKPPEGSCSICLEPASLSVMVPGKDAPGAINP